MFQCPEFQEMVGSYELFFSIYPKCLYEYQNLDKFGHRELIILYMPK